MIAQKQPPDILAEILREAGVEAVIASAGTVPSQVLTRLNLGMVIWVVEKSSRHMDWSRSADQNLDGIDVSVWHELIEGNAESSPTEPTSVNQDSKLPSVVMVWQGATALQYKIVEYPQKVS